MYVKMASVEDIPDIISIMRDSLYTELGRRKVSFEQSILESAVRRHFHTDRFTIVLHEGRCRGFMWCTTGKPAGGRTPLKIIMISLEPSNTWGDAAKALMDDAREYAYSRGLDYTSILRYREKPVRNLYCDTDSGEYFCKTGR